MSTVAAPAYPLYDMGALTPRIHPRATQAVREPAYPLYEGWGLHGFGAASISPGGAGIGPWSVVGPATVCKGGGTACSAAISAAQGAAQGFSIGGPIGAGIGAIAGAIAGIWASHAARAKGAKTENQAVNSAVQAFDQSIKAIFDAANSSDPTVNISGAQAAEQCQQVLQAYWQSMAPFMTGPGRKDSSNFGANCGDGSLNPAGPCAGTPGGHKCDSHCTAACCVGCQDLYPTILQAVQVFNSPTGGTITVCGVASSKYGASARSSYTLTYSPPTFAGQAGGLISELTSGFTTGAGGGGTTSALLLPLALVAGLLLFLR
jgi:gas vesicle protein